MTASVRDLGTTARVVKASSLVPLNTLILRCIHRRRKCWYIEDQSYIGDPNGLHGVEDFA
jgi:hypothetical protein